MRQFFKTLSLLSAALLLSACSGIEPEEREYALGMLIGGENVSIAAAELSGEAEGRPSCTFLDGRGKTLAQAISNISADTGGALYTGQLMLCVIEKDTLDKKSLSELISLFCTDDDLSRGAAVAVTDDIEVLKTADKEGKDITRYMREYCKSSTKTGKGLTLDCDSLIHTLISTDGDALIPYLECKNGELRINGATALNNWQYAETVDMQAAEAALWLIHGKKSSIVINSGDNIIEFDKVSVSKKISDGIEYKIKTRARLLQSGGELDTEKAEKELASKILSAAQRLYAQGCDYSEAAEFYRLKTQRKAEAKDISHKITLKTTWKGM